ncbi:hypothetical protein [Prosthecobacter fluviatilis]|uniref:Nucleotide-diphospho-sugar transferase domain-containing protein n=1 Tax=Prosthecobacter fluviatilis TaxID=445931 RepID=A0ABW0KQD5_9BACT
MKLESIVTLASPEVRLRFIAMERSLRATGCNLPLRVIPYNEGRFDLPANAEWWEDIEMSEWLKSRGAHPAMRKCQCLTIANFQFVDADVIFLRNPAEILKPLDGFVTSCGHWRNTGHTVTRQSWPIFASMSTMWQKWVFNSGQWASDRILHTRESIYECCESKFKETCLTYNNCDQPGINLLVISSGVPVHNLTLPPWNMESTWAGDYLGSNFESYWGDVDRKPYLLHWAGCAMDKRRPIDGLMERFLNPDELKAWRSDVESCARSSVSGILRSIPWRLYRAIRCFKMSLFSE